jgi:hypothetical protein
MITDDEIPQGVVVAVIPPGPGNIPFPRNGAPCEGSLTAIIALASTSAPESSARRCSNMFVL